MKNTGGLEKNLPKGMQLMHEEVEPCKSTPWGLKNQVRRVYPDPELLLSATEK